MLSACVEYEDGDGREQASGLAHLRLQRLPIGAVAALAEDETVIARALELRAAELLTQARDAALRRDWTEVDQLLATALTEAGENQWVAATTSALQDYADLRDQAMFSKEAYFASRKKRMRLAGQDETAAYSVRAESVKPGWARRKPRQGKGLSGNGDAE